MNSLYHHIPFRLVVPVNVVETEMRMRPVVATTLHNRIDVNHPTSVMNSLCHHIPFRLVVPVNVAETEVVAMTLHNRVEERLAPHSLLDSPDFHCHRHSPHHYVHSQMLLEIDYTQLRGWSRGCTAAWVGGRLR
jgi:hypothetical protein